MTAAREGLFRVGSASVDITPPLEVPYLAWQPRHQPFAGVHDPLIARCVVVEAGRERVVMIGANAIGFASTLLGPGRDFVAEVRARVGAVAGVCPNSVMLAAAHVHSTPDTLDFRPLRENPRAGAWLESLIGKLADCAAESTRTLFDAHMTAASTALPGFSKNRRGEPWLDDTVTAIRFQSPDAARSVVLLHFACHPVIVQVQPLVSGDYVGVAERFVESSLPGLGQCLFLQGACGDVNPSVGDSRDFADVERMGLALGRCAAEMVSGSAHAGSPPQPAIVSCLSRQMMLASRELPVASVPAGFTGSMAEELAARRLEGDAPFRCEVQMLRLGNVVLAAVPGEPVSRFAIELRAAARPLQALTVGYANGYLGYILPPDMFEKGGYEAQPGPWSKVSPQAYDLLSGALREMMVELRRP
jgi:neutral ceramidase